MGKAGLFLQVRQAQHRAAQLIERYGIERAEHIRLEDIAFDLGAVVLEGSLMGAAARLVATKSGAVIRVNRDNPYPNRARFSIAHELGHLVLKHGHSFERVCSDEDMLAWYSNSDETQANAFATELLLPKVLVKPRCDVVEVTFDPVRKLAEEFRTSLTSTGIRFVQFCPETCALVFSKENKVRWCVGSEEWWGFIERGSTLDSATLASRFFQGKDLPEDADEVPGDAWLDRKAPETIVEHSVASRELGFVLSLLWVEGSDD